MLKRLLGFLVLIFILCISNLEVKAFQNNFREYYDKISFKEVRNVSDGRSGTNVVRFGDHVEFLVNNPDSVELIDFEFNLYIDGQRLPTYVPISVENDRFIFVLYELDTLSNLLQASINSWGVHNREVRMSIGDSSGNHVHVRKPNITIDFDPHYSYRSWLGRGVILLVIFFFFRLVKRDTFLRDHKTGKYSLSRSQLAWWTMIVLCSYIALWSDSGILVVLTTDTLVLLGISSVTAAVAQTIDKDKAKIKSPIAVKQQGNYLDHILSDGSGISIQRFQSVVFTFFIGIFFIYKVIADFEMPDIDNGILGLMGISSATYAGLKTNENLSSRESSD